MKLGDRKLWTRLLIQAEELDDLLQALAEGELVAARQHRHRAQAKLLQLGEACRVFENVNRYEVDPTDR